MADDPEVSSGGGRMGALMERKVFGLPLPVVGAVVLGGAILMYRIFGAKKAAGGSSPGQGTQFNSTTTRTDPTTGVSTSYSASGDGYLPGFLSTQAGPMPYQQGDVYVNYPVQTNMPTPAGPPPSNPDLFNDKGQDLGQYRYGSDEIAYLWSNIGKYGLTSPIVQDIQDSYTKMVAKVGQQQADMYHYSYIGPGNVQAIPRGEANTTQTTTGLPGSPVYGTPPYQFGQPGAVQGGGSQNPTGARAGG